MKRVLVLVVLATLFTSCGLKEIKGNMPTDSTATQVDSVAIDSIASAFDSVNVDTTKTDSI